MNILGNSSLLPLVDKLRSIHPLTQAEQLAVGAMPRQIRIVPADQDITHDGDKPTQSCIILTGFVIRYKLIGDSGRRQIMAFYLPGDMPDLMSLHLNILDSSLGTLVASTVAVVDHRVLRGLAHDYARIGDALWRDTLIDAAIGREWLVGMGSRSAYSRLAHLFCELFQRMDAIGLVDGKSIRLPITQNTMSDALGLSAVHVNRVVQELRANGLIIWKSGVLTVEDWGGLQDAGAFDPAYLNIRRLATSPEIIPP